MNAPLSRYLTRFAAEAAVAAPPSHAVVEPMVTMTVAELDARLEAAHARARTEAEALHAAERAALEQAQATAVADAVADARAGWCAGVAGETTAAVAKAFDTLHETLADATAKALRPLLAEAARERVLAALATTVTRLLSDPLRPAVTVRGPADLVAALRARGVPTGVSIVVAETTEIVVSCGGTLVETRLAAALADIAGA